MFQPAQSCIQCGAAVLAADSRFCFACGAAIPGSNDRFCIQCGVAIPLSPHELEAENLEFVQAQLEVIQEVEKAIQEHEREEQIGIDWKFLLRSLQVVFAVGLIWILIGALNPDLQDLVLVPDALHNDKILEFLFGEDSAQQRSCVNTWGERYDCDGDTGWGLPNDSSWGLPN